MKICFFTRPVFYKDSKIAPEVVMSFELRTTNKSFLQVPTIEFNLENFRKRIETFSSAILQLKN